MNTKLLTLALLLPLAGCGLVPPDIKEVSDGDVPATSDHGPLSGTAVLEFEIEKKVYCELKQAVVDANQHSLEEGDDLDHMRPTNKLPLDPAWIAEVSLTFQVDESTALNPGVTVNHAFQNGLVGGGGGVPASTFQQLFSFGLGGTLSQTGTTIDKYDPYWTIAFLNRAPHQDAICVNPANDHVLAAYVKANGGDIRSSPFLISGELGIEKWLIGALVISNNLYSIGTASQVVGSPSGSHPQALTHEIKFVVVTSGNATPTWKLIPVSANSGTLPLFAASRTRTHDLIITIGPNKTQTDYTHLASQIGNAVSNGNMARAIP